VDSIGWFAHASRKIRRSLADGARCRPAAGGHVEERSLAVPRVDRAKTNAIRLTPWIVARRRAAAGGRVVAAGTSRPVTGNPVDPVCDPAAGGGRQRAAPDRGVELAAVGAEQMTPLATRRRDLRFVIRDSRDGRRILNPSPQPQSRIPTRPQLASSAWSARKSMKIGARLNRMAAARSGEVDRPVAQSRPFNWLIRSVRLSE